MTFTVVVASVHASVNVMHSESGESTEPSAVLQLWGLVAAPGRGPRASADVHAVAQAALEVADEDGFEAVTLGAVARRLGLTTTALYRYVDSKATLVEVMVDRALGPAPAPPAGDTRRQVEAWVEALWGRYQAHPWLSTFPLERPPRSPHAVAWMDLLVGLLDSAGSADPLGAALAADVLVRGYAGLAVVAAAAPPPSPALAAEIARRHPHLTSGTSREGDLLDSLVEAVLRTSGLDG